jgi:hypothetical protein
MRTPTLRRALFVLLVASPNAAWSAASAPRTAAADRQALVALEHEWLVAHDAPTLDRRKVKQVGVFRRLELQGLR